jgi:putative nucleotidyltransferase with HDIG domain
MSVVANARECKIGGCESPALKLYLGDVINGLSTALDAVDQRLNAHHKVVAYVAINLLAIIGEPENDTIYAALVHDLGLVRNYHENTTTISERELDLSHTVVGAHYLMSVPKLAFLSDLTLHHHFSYTNQQRLHARGVTLHPHSDILYAADRLALFIDSIGGALTQNAKQQVSDYITFGRLIEFSERSSKAALALIETDSFWLDLTTDRLSRVIDRKLQSKELLHYAEALQIAKLFSAIIDGRSRFTANHSTGVGILAHKLADASGWSTRQSEKLLVAGYLHDIGKLAVRNQIIDKPSKLSDAEWRVMRSHVFHTRRILETIPGLEEVVDWASDHHERINGEGYPFRKRGDEISTGARMIAVSDVMTALTENRPYRAQLSQDQVLGILKSQVDQGALDGRIVECAGDNYEQLNAARNEAQKIQDATSDLFWQNVEVSVKSLVSQFAS